MILLLNFVVVNCYAVSLTQEHNCYDAHVIKTILIQIIMHAGQTLSVLALPAPSPDKGGRLW